MAWAKKEKKIHTGKPRILHGSIFHRLRPKCIIHSNFWFLFLFLSSYIHCFSFHFQSFFFLFFFSHLPESHIIGLHRPYLFIGLYYYSYFIGDGTVWVNLVGGGAILFLFHWGWDSLDYYYFFLNFFLAFFSQTTQPIYPIYGYKF